MLCTSRRWQLQLDHGRREGQHTVDHPDVELRLFRGGLDDRVGDLEDVDVHRDALHLSRVQVGLQLQLDHGRRVGQHTVDHPEGMLHHRDSQLAAC